MPSWSPLELQARLAIHDVAERCFELGAASISFSHGVIASLSDLSEISSLSLSIAGYNYRGHNWHSHRASESRSNGSFPKFIQVHEFTWAL